MTTEQPTITTLEGLISTINTDRPTFRWFTFLVTHKDIQSQLVKDADIKNEYRTLNTLIVKKRILYVGFVAYLISIFVSQAYVFLWGTIFFYLLGLKWYLDKKKYIQQISRHLLSRDFSQKEIEQSTLYQLAEVYSRNYDIPSLVDTINTLDKASRKTVILTFCVLVFVSPFQLTIMQVILGTFITFLIVYAILCTDLLYKNIK